MKPLIILTDKDIARIVGKETTEYENVMKYAPYIDEPDFPKLECLPVRIGNYAVTFDFPYFTTYCKMIQQPDYAHLKLTIVPNGRIIEMKSFKLYLQAFRNMDIYQEEATNVVFIDVIRACKPLYAELEAIWDPRGSMGTRVNIAYRSPGYIAPDELVISGSPLAAPTIPVTGE